MGTYDIVTVENFLCPYCNEKSKVEFQTKDGNYFMNRFKVGDIFQKKHGGVVNGLGKFRFIEAIGSCESFTCQLEAAKESIWENGYYGGFSRSFDVIIWLDNRGKITNKVEVIDLNNHTGVMHGKPGEKKAEDYQSIGHWEGKGKNKKWISKKVKLTTNGWLDKFKSDTTWDMESKNIYEALLYVLNEEDNEDFFRKWFVLRYNFKKMLITIKEKLKLKDDEEFASLFLSNDMLNIIEFCDGNNNINT